MSKRKSIIAMGLMLALVSCTRQISPDVYRAGTVGAVSTTYMGVIRSMRTVIAAEDDLGDNGLGIVAGGAAGGVVGNAVGRGQVVPTAIGAVAGAVAGSLIERQAKQQTAWEYVVELDGEGMVTVVQGAGEVLGINQPVYVIISASGRSRIIPQ